MKTHPVSDHGKEWPKGKPWPQAPAGVSPCDQALYRVADGGLVGFIAMNSGEHCMVLDTGQSVVGHLRLLDPFRTERLLVEYARTHPAQAESLRTIMVCQHDAAARTEAVVAAVAEPEPAESDLAFIPQTVAEAEAAARAERLVGDTQPLAVTE